MSDTLTVTIGYFGPGTGATIFTGSVPEPTPDDVTEPVLTFAIPPTFFDLEEPLGETHGVPGIISDYVDILTPIEVRFISSDDPSIYANLPPASGFIVENIETGGSVVYALSFRSDAVPEPGSIALFSVALFAMRPSVRYARSGRVFAS